MGSVRRTVYRMVCLVVLGETYLMFGCLLDEGAVGAVFRLGGVRLYGCFGGKPANGLGTPS